MKKYLNVEDIQLVYSGANYFEVLDRIIDESKETLHVQTYIFDADKTGTRVLEKLKNAVKRGVKVYLLSDAYGSFPFPSELSKEVAAAGIHFRLFSPLFSGESGYFGRRLHHKIVVADKKMAMIGGINIADKYSYGSADEQVWLDYALFIKGEACEYLHLLCEQVYHKKRSKLVSWEKNTKINTGSANAPLLRFRRNDWIKGKNEIHQSYIAAISQAKSSITIVASYFLPGNHFRRILRNAAKRGVEIKIILAGKSDVSSVRLAQNYLYGFYLSNNIQLFEWQNSVLHGKAMLVDKSWATIGSYNLNFLSHYISIELNADVIDHNLALQFTEHLEDILKKSCQVVELEKTLKKRTRLGSIGMWLAYNFFRLLKDISVSKKSKKD